MLELAKKEIDGHVYEFEQFGAKKATKLLVRIARIAGQPMAIAGAEIAKSKDGVAERLNSVSLITSIVGSLTEKLDENEVLDLIESFVANEKVLCDGKKIVFDTHYQQRLDHMFRVLWAALEVQYGNFFGALSAFLPSARPPVSNRGPQA